MRKWTQDTLTSLDPLMEQFDACSRVYSAAAKQTVALCLHVILTGQS